MADITIVNGVYKPTYNWGAPSCIENGHDLHSYVGTTAFVRFFPGIMVAHPVENETDLHEAVGEDHEEAYTSPVINWFISPSNYSYKML